ncbi:MAG: hypothetical protein DME33_09725 [Verrucomicrobia bacterium]|nr:MAG: hypothetical protein DME33_09725 [Verrucomicrobiota bacterium]
MALPVVRACGGGCRERTRYHCREARYDYGGRFPSGCAKQTEEKLMAHRYQRGCLRKESRKNGMLWMLRYYAIRPADGKKVQRTLFVGYVVDFPTQSDAWAEADRLHLAEKINQPGRLGTASFAQIARHYADNELLRLANTTEYCYHHIIDDYLVPRWGSCYAVEIKPNEVERWLNSLSKEAKAKNGLEWPTLRKMRNVINLIYAHAQRQGLIPEDLKYNPVRPAGLGGARCKCTSDYEALILIPEQTFTILNLVPTLERTLILLVAVTALRISEALGLQWRDIDYENSQINVRRRWIRGNIDKPKSKASKAPVAMAPLLAEWLRAWRNESMHSKPEDWIFASIKTNGRTPRVGNMLVADHLRPAAAKSGVFKNGVPKRFGFHNLRHSLSSFLITEKKADVRTVQDTLRHAKPDMTLGAYTKSPMKARIAAQQQVLDAIFDKSASTGAVQ